MTNAKLKAAVLERFANEGAWVDSKLQLRHLCRLAEEHTGQARAPKESQFDYLFRFAGLKHEYTPGREAPTFRPFIPANHRHWRLADIDRDQPPMMTPNGIGNFKQPGGFMPEVWGAGR